MSDKNRKRLYHQLESFYMGKLSEDYFHDSSYRKFYRKVYFETFRHIGFLEKILAKYIKKDPGHKAKAAMTLGLSQLYFINDVPDYAAVNETVEAIPKGQRGFVNAVLRNAIRDRDKNLAEYKITDDFPEWFVKKWHFMLGDERFDNFISCLNTAPPVYAVNLDTLEIEIIEKYDSNDKSKYYMDKASALIPTIAGEDFAPMNIMDACAAPGGKTVILSKKYPDSQIMAVEINEIRFGKMKAMHKNMKLSNITPVNADIFNIKQERDFDLVLLDAPCTAMGTIRKHPEVRWLRKENDFKEKAEVQYKMLEHVSGFIAEGGRVVYSVCSLEPEEGSDIIRRFLIDHPEFKLIKPACEEKFIMDDFFLSYPCTTSCDGFFAAVLEYSP